MGEKRHTDADSGVVASGKQNVAGWVPVFWLRAVRWWHEEMADNWMGPLTIHQLWSFWLFQWENIKTLAAGVISRLNIRYTICDSFFFPFTSKSSFSNCGKDSYLTCTVFHWLSPLLLTFLLRISLDGFLFAPFKPEMTGLNKSFDNVQSKDWEQSSCTVWGPVKKRNQARVIDSLSCHPRDLNLSIFLNSCCLSNESVDNVCLIGRLGSQLCKPIPTFKCKPKKAETLFVFWLIWK